MGTQASWDWKVALSCSQIWSKADPGLLLGPLHSYLGRYLNRVEPTPDPHPQALAPAREEPTNVRDYVAAVAIRLTFAPCVRVSRWHAALEARSTLALVPVLLLTNTKPASSTDVMRPSLLYAAFLALQVNISTIRYGKWQVQLKSARPSDRIYRNSDTTIHALVSRNEESRPSDECENRAKQIC